MATITGLTAERMLEIEAESVIDGEIVNGHLILTKHDGTTIDAGPVLGPTGPAGPPGPAGGLIPGEVRLWPGDSLPNPANYGKWVWADGAVYAVTTYPKAAGNIATQWRTFAGASDPGASNFRVPDLRGLVAAGMDSMPGGSRANRMTRSVAITIAGRTGEETHIVSVAEMPNHGHGINDPTHAHSVYDPTHAHGVGDPGHQHAEAENVLRQNMQEGFPGNSGVIKDWSAPAYTGVAGTGIWIGGAATGIGIYGAGTGISVQANGSGGAHENVQPTVFVPYIVKLDD
jgi:microcystin-dependent protein